MAATFHRRCARWATNTLCGHDPGNLAILALRGLSKTYGDARVLDAVALEVGASEVHALLGENGAGKSTLIKIVAGVVTPEAGSVTVGGRALHFGSPRGAMQAGVATLFQESRWWAACRSRRTSCSAVPRPRALDGPLA